MKLIMISSYFLSFMYMSSSHPVLLMTFILTQTIMICVVAWISLKISWFSYILFLIFLGGLMVLFIYITSLASNELIIVKMESMTTTLVILIFTLIMMIFSLNFQQLSYMPSIMIKSFSFMYSWNLMMLTLAAMVYLLLTLIIVVKVSNKFDAPIKNMIMN